MAPQNDTYEMLDTSPEGGGKGKLIAALVVLLLLLGGAAAYFLGSRDSGGGETARTQANGGTSSAPGATAPGGTTQAPAAANSAAPAANTAGATAPPTGATTNTTPTGGRTGGGGASAGAGGDVVHFALNATQVSAADATRIDAFWQKIKDGSGGTITVEGHADSTGPEAHNEWLARARAEEVASLLRRKGGDKKYKFNVSGFSSSKPLADNGTEDGRAKNRRVEVSYAGGN